MGQMDKTPLFGLGISIACMVVSAIVVKQYFSKMPTGCAFVTQPGLVGLLLGALPEMWKYILRYEAHSGLAEYHEQEGDTLYFDFGLLRYFMPAVVITRDPRNVKYMLKTKFDSFVKGVTFHTIGLDLLGDGIFNVDGDLWFKQRKTASQMFTANRFKQHIWKVVRKNCDKVISLLRASQEPTVDIFNVLNRFTLDSIGEIGFGTDIGSLENPESPFLGSFDAAQRLMFIRFVLPCWRFLYARQSLSFLFVTRGATPNLGRRYSRRIVGHRYVVARTVEFSFTICALLPTYLFIYPVLPYPIPLQPDPPPPHPIRSYLIYLFLVYLCTGL